MKKALVVMLAVAACVSSARAEGPRLLLTQMSKITLDAWAMGSESGARIYGDRLVVPLGYKGVAVYDISDPTRPSLVARINTTTLGDQGGASALLPDGRLVVSLPVRRTLAVVDLSGPVPRKIGEFGGIPQTIELATTESSLLVYAQSSMAYLGGLHVFDTSPQIPTDRGSFQTNLIDPGLFVHDAGIAYFARTPSGPDDPPRIDIVNIAGPGDPDLLATWSAPILGNIVGIDVVADRMAIAAYWGGVWIIDTSTFAALRMIAHEDWKDPSIHSIAVAYMPPFVLLLQGAPSASLRQLDTLQVLEDGTIKWMDGALPIDGYPMALMHSGSLVVVQAATDPNGDGSPDQTELTLYASDVDLFADDFEIGRAK
jgi:hypothetical protein